MIYQVEDGVLAELMGWAEYKVDKAQFIYTLCTLRDDSSDENTKKYFQEAINEACGEDYCLDCGEELTGVPVPEYHTELQGNPIEWITGYYICPKCNTKYDY